MIRRVFYRLRLVITDRHGLLVAAGAAALLVRGSFCGLRLQRELWVEIGAAGLLAMLLLLRLLIGRPQRRAERAREIDQLELGLLLLANSYVLMQATGGPGSLLQPAAYLLLAYLAGFNTRWVGLALIAATLGYQASLHWASGELPRGLWQPFALRGAFIVCFGLAYHLLLQAEVARRRHEHRRSLEAEIRAMRDEARDFRLISSALSSSECRDRAEEEQKLARGAVESIHQGMYFVLELLKKSLDLQTCVLLWLDDSGERLRIKELVTDSRLITEVPISACAGALGGVIKNRILLNLRAPRHGSRGIPYYNGPEQVGAFLGAPVFEGNHLRGVLCADRRGDRPFTAAEEQLMLEATRQVLRAIQAERVFAAVERSKYEHERFYRASTMLNSALTLAQVYDTAFSAAREIVEFDFGAITLYDRARGKHIICRVVSDKLSSGMTEFEGAQFGDNAGLCSMVVKNKHLLPAGEDLRERDTVVFTRKQRLRGMESLLVLPLIVQDNAIGTFVLAARATSRFQKKTREMLGVISNQVAVSIENAKIYKRMEEMATTDGLTGLPNHRTFQARFSEMLARSERHGKPLSLVLTDIDKFKSVNDTHGHPVGDAVLKRVAKVLAEQVRKVDLAARYGGEEFVMVLEETDARGAHLFCERVRQEVAPQLMTSDKGSFRISISLGIASYPAEGKDKALLIERADQALYAAKERGRNRTVLYAELHKGSKRAQSGAALGGGK